MADLPIKSPNKKWQHDHLIDFCAKSFGGYWGFTEYSRNGYISNSHYDWDASQIGMLKGSIVTHFGIWNYQSRIGHDSVKTGGIGVVCTDMRHRRRGYMAETAVAAIRSMKAHGYQLSVLFGISEFYNKYGYVDGWDNSEIRIAHGDLPRPEKGMRLRKHAYVKNGELDTLYNRENRGLTGTAVRPTYGGNRRPDLWQCWTWPDENGAVAGYVVCAAKNGTFSVVDWAGMAHAVLAATALLMRRLQCSEVRFVDAHEESELYRNLHTLNYRRETTHTRNGSCMIRIVNAHSLFSSIRRTLGKRLRESAAAGWSGTLKIVYPEAACYLLVDGGKIRVSPTPEAGTPVRHTLKAGHELAQLLMGVDDPREIIRRNGMKTTGDAKALICALFPQQHPSLSAWDHF